MGKYQEVYYIGRAIEGIKRELDNLVSKEDTEKDALDSISEYEHCINAIEEIYAPFQEDVKEDLNSESGGIVGFSKDLDDLKTKCRKTRKKLETIINLNEQQNNLVELTGVQNA